MSIHFYDEQGGVYANHIDAIKSKRPCKLYYHDSFYDNVVWSHEPTLSLKQLYKLRAEELRVWWSRFTKRV